MNHIQIPALGRCATLGTLYDAQTEQFREYMFKGPIDSQFINSSQTPNTSTEMNLANTISEKYNLFDLKAEVSASILCGLFTITGSAKFLTEEKKSGRQGQGFMIHKNSTVSESLQVYYEGLKDLYNTKLLEHQHATHIVTGIKWGANVAISFTDSYQESENRADMNGSLAIAFDKLKFLISVEGSASIDSKEKDKDERLGFSMKIHGDISLPTEFPQTVKEIQELVKKIPEYIAKSNGGKGVQLEYTLISISDLKDFLSLIIQQEKFFKKLDESNDHQIIQLFDEISKMEQRLYDIEKDFSSYSICTLSKTREKLITLQNKFRRSKINLQTLIKNTMVEMRTSEIAGPAKLREVFENYAKDKFSPLNVEKKLNEFKEAFDKIDLFKVFRDFYPDVEYIGHGGNLGNRLLKKESIGKLTYILYMKPEFTKNDPNSWSECSHAFFSSLYQPCNKLFVVDCDFHSSTEEEEKCASLRKTTIKQRYGGVITFHDVVSELNLRKESSNLKFKALGRFAKIGQFYNERTDSFLSGQTTALKANYPSSVLIPEKRERVDTNYIPGETFEQKCKALRVTNDQKMSILSKSIDLTRSGRYLQEEADGDGSQVKSILHCQKTEKEKINLQDSNFANSLAVQEIMKIEATHFVSSIKFGFNTIFSIEAPKDLTKTNVREYLDKNARYLRQALIKSCCSSNINSGSSADAETEKKTKKEQPQLKIIEEEDLKKLSSDVKIKIFSDIQSEESPPVEVDGVEELILYFNNIFFPQQSFQSKGQSISYVLSPIENLSKSHGILRPQIQGNCSIGDSMTPESSIKQLCEKLNRRIETIERNYGKLQTQIESFKR